MVAVHLCNEFAVGSVNPVLSTLFRMSMCTVLLEMKPDGRTDLQSSMSLSSRDSTYSLAFTVCWNLLGKAMFPDVKNDK